jgi:hypothetical protein
MTIDPLTPLQRDLLRELERSQRGGQKRPLGVVPIGRPEDETAPTAPRPGAVKVR